MAVALASSDALAADVPTNVVVAAGQTSATFTVTAGVVSADQVATISAATGGVSVTCQFTAQP
jgi:S1-C subfamily serine protease